MTRYFKILNYLLVDNVTMFVPQKGQTGHLPLEETHHLPTEKYDIVYQNVPQKGHIYCLLFRVNNTIKTTKYM